MEYAIEMKGVSFSYGTTHVLEDVDLLVKKGEFLAILGPNGGGKTTLLKLILGLLVPQKGEIRLLGQSPVSARHRVGYLPQERDFNLSFPITVEELTRMGRLGRVGKGDKSKVKDEEAVQKCLELVGLWDKRDWPISNLSGGQRQRAFIARALATSPEILLLDEPTSNVDPEFQTDLYQILAELNKTITIVVITHDIGVISSYVKSVACVNKHLTFHEEGQITEAMLSKAYPCPVELVAHGIPHRVFHRHS